jgi:hypothetical protein
MNSFHREICRIREAARGRWQEYYSVVLITYKGAWD